MRPAQLGDALLTPKTLEHDADLLFRRELSSSTATDVAYCRFGGLLLLMIRQVEARRVFCSSVAVATQPGFSEPSFDHASIRTLGGFR